MIVYLDTETNNISPGKIIQLSYILTTGKKIIGRNWFFLVDYITPGSTAIHKINLERLRELASGKFEDYAEIIYNELTIAEMIVGHNIDFDFRFLKKEFIRADFIFRPKKLLCTMRTNTRRGEKWPKLSELCKRLRISKNTIYFFAKQIFGGCQGEHDSRFDATAAFLCHRKTLKRKKQNGNKNKIRH